MVAVILSSSTASEVHARANEFQKWSEGMATFSFKISDLDFSDPYHFVLYECAEKDVD